MQTRTYKKATRKPASSLLAYANHWLDRAGARLCIYSLLFLTLSCTEADTSYRPEILGGHVTIQPNSSGNTLPNLLYHFYDKNTQNYPLTFLCDGTGIFTGNLREGEYRVIATNNTASGVDYETMDKHETALVCAKPYDNNNRSKDYIFLQQPDMIYSVIVDELAISDGDTTNIAPLAQLLTKTITLSFFVQGNLSTEVKAINAVVHGVYPSVLLYTGKPNSTDLNNQSGAIRISAQQVSNTNEWQGVAHIFGLYDPKYGSNYENILSISIENSGGESETTDVDLTDLLSDIIKENGGDIPVELPIKVDLTKEITLIGNATLWTEGNTGEGEILPAD